MIGRVAMDFPYKRRRLLGHGRIDQELQTQRTQQEQLLKSRFESIFEKYEKDFTDLGDVIDMTTAQIAVDNGHIQKMKYERDIGDGVDGQLIDLAASDTEDTDDTDDEGSRSCNEDTEDTKTSASLFADQGDVQLYQTAFEGLDDYDELGDAPPPKQQIRPPQADTDLDELSLANLQSISPFEAASRSRRLIWDKSAQFVEPKWVAPPLPHERGKLRPLHRRFIIPLPVKIRRNTVNLSDWRQKHSIWDTRADSNEPAEISPEDQEVAAISESHTIDSSMINAWTAEEESRLRGLKASIRLSDEELVKYFPGKTASLLTARWNHLKASDQLQGELNANNDGHPSSQLVEGSSNTRLSSGREEVVMPDHDYQCSTSAVALAPEETQRSSGKIRLPVSQNPTKLTGQVSTSVFKRPRREIPDSDSPAASSSPLLLHTQANSRSTKQHSGPLVHEISDSEDEINGASNTSSKVETASKQKREATSRAKAGNAHPPHVIPSSQKSSQQRLHGILQPEAVNSKKKVVPKGQKPLGRVTSQKPTRTSPNERRLEISDSQSPQLCPASDKEPSTPKSIGNASTSPEGSKTTGRTADRKRTITKQPINSSHRKIATPMSLQALRAAGSSQRRDTKDKDLPKSLSQLCDESDDDLSKTPPASVPASSKKPLTLTPLDMDAISREARDCSDDELG